jgi:D-glycero-alpha-D-manno-heptose-7-phosphate kinase
MPDLKNSNPAWHFIEVSAPCRIDLGGTFDISTFSYPLRRLGPLTFNLAVDLRTRVRLRPFDAGQVKVSSAGFENAVFEAARAPFDHPLGLMFAVAAHFGAEGVAIDIHSSSPPRSALGGSSVAAVALVTALNTLTGRRTGRGLIGRGPGAVALTAHGIEEGVLRMPCGFQDQLAAVYGGVHAWYWRPADGRLPYLRRAVAKKADYRRLERHLLLAYCGAPHTSTDVNGRWVDGFVAGRHRRLWEEMVTCTRGFVAALAGGDIEAATGFMRRELALRRRITPDVLDETGILLTRAAEEADCAARFTGAGGGGCLWALGSVPNIDRLEKTWESIVSTRAGARLLPLKVAARGVSIDANE